MIKETDSSACSKDWLDFKLDEEKSSGQDIKKEGEGIWSELTWIMEKEELWRTG
jgi:hypothetical protein